MKYSEWTEWLEADGYVNQRPARNPISLVDGASIDKEIAEEIPCPECGGKCNYEPWVQTGSYRAFSVCTACGEAYEF